MRIARLILRTSDLDRAVSFWSEAVGFPLTNSHEPFAFLDAEGVQLVLNAVDADINDESITEIVIEADDVESSFEGMKGRGVPFEVELRPVTSEGSRTLMAAHFRDPDGHLGSVTGWVDE